MLIKTEHFDRDPGWIGVHNQLQPKDPPVVTQNFGFSLTNRSGSGRGEIGGIITRSTTPAWYAERMAPRTLRHRLEASGTLSVVASSKSGGLFFGWFNSERQGWRPVNFLGFRLDARGDKVGVYVDYTTGTFKAGGVNTKHRLPIDGSRHVWRLVYDPQAAGGDGVITFELDDKKPVTLTLAPGHQWEGATFNRFGLFNLQTPGGSMVAYFDDLLHDGEPECFHVDPQWDGHNNRIEFEDTEQRSAHHFGWSRTNFAGGAPGEIGGTIWRVEPDAPQLAFYADRTQPLGLDGPLEASGSIALTRGSSDSGVYLGWFAAQPHGEPPADFVGIAIEGPSRVGHYFRPIYGTSKDGRGDAETGPVLRPDGSRHQWSLSYDPTANNRQGRLRATLDGVPMTLDLERGHKKEGARLERFGLLTMRRGGHHLTVFIDDLRYTVGRAGRYRVEASVLPSPPKGEGGMEE